MMKIKVNNIIKLIVVIFIIFLLLFFLHSKKSYQKSYIIKNFSIIEQYKKDHKKYYLKVKYNSKEYEYIIDNFNKKKIVVDVDYFEDEDVSCLSLILKKNKKSDILCYQNNELLTINNIENEKVLKHYNIKSLKSTKEVYHKVNIYNVKDHNYLLWDYKNMLFISNDKNKTLNITNTDVYNLKIVGQVKNYILIADYNELYEFSKFYIINLKNGSLKEFKTKYKISNDSYILGSYNDSIYLVDKKNKVEYEIVPSYKKIRIIAKDKASALIYDNGFKKISLNKLLTKEYSFKEQKIYNYKIMNNALYLTYYKSSNNIKISNLENLKIIKEADDKIIYLSDNTLYLYQNNYEIKVMDYFEWNFNYKNMIFFY